MPLRLFSAGLILLLLSRPLSAGNLVPNGDFECGNGPADGFGADNIAFWTTICPSVRWFGTLPGDSTMSDVLHPFAFNELPIVDNASPGGNDRWMYIRGDVGGDPGSVKGSITARLIAPLVPGQSYTLSYYAATRNPATAGFPGRGHLYFYLSSAPITCVIAPPASTACNANPNTCNCTTGNCGSHLYDSTVNGPLREWHYFNYTFTAAVAHEYIGITAAADDYNVCIDQLSIVPSNESPEFSCCEALPTAVLAVNPDACLGGPLIVDGSASTNETNFFIECIKVDAVGSFNPTVPLEGDSIWFEDQTAGSFNIHDYLSCPGPGVYKIKLAVQNACANWVETNQWVTIIDCKRVPAMNATSMATMVVLLSLAASICLSRRRLSMAAN